MRLSTSRAGFDRQVVIVAGLTLAASGAALARDITVSRVLGFGPVLDAWAIALGLTVLATSALLTSIGATTVPEFTRLRRFGTPTERASYATQLVAATGLIGLVLGILVWAASPWVAVLLAPPEVRGQLEPALRVLGLTAVSASLLKGTGVALLQSNQRYALGAVSAAITATIVLLAARLVPGVAASDLAAAHGGGLILEAILLVGLTLRVTGAQRFSLRELVRRGRSLVRPVGLTASAALILSVNPLVDLWFAAKIQDGGSGQLTLAGRIPLAVAALLTTSFATPAFPKIAEGAILGPEAATRAAVSAARASVPIAVAATIVIAAASVPLADLALTGATIDADEARSVAVVQIIYALTVVPYVWTALLLRAIQALAGYRTLLALGLIGFLSNLFLDAMLGSLLGLPGLAAATTAVYTGLCAFAFMRLGDRASTQPVVDDS